MAGMSSTAKPAARAMAALLVATALLAVGCDRARMQYLTDRRYEPRPLSHSIDLYQGKLDVPHEEIAWLDTGGVALSEGETALSTDTRRVLIAELKERARQVGGDAVIEVTMLERPQRGWVRDPSTPFRSFRQGWTDFYFLRGKAVRFKAPLIETGEARGLEFTENELTSPTVGELGRPGLRSRLRIQEDMPLPQIQLEPEP